MTFTSRFVAGLKWSIGITLALVACLVTGMLIAGLTGWTFYIWLLPLAAVFVVQTYLLGAIMEEPTVVMEGGGDEADSISGAGGAD